jgi:Membrane bound FAD containing D-sorbitol dehydrogenase
MLATAVFLVSRSRPERALALDGASGGFPPATVPGADLPLRDFLELSRCVTGKPELPETVGRRLLALYKSAPDRLKGVSEFHRRIAALNGSEAPSIDFDAWMHSAGPAEDALRRTARQLLEQWYTGIYEDGRQTLVFSYEDALMYRPCAEVHPVPTRCGGEMGFWSKPPEGAPEAPIGVPDPLPDRRD